MEAIQGALINGIVTLFVSGIISVAGMIWAIVKMHFSLKAARTEIAELKAWKAKHDETTGDIAKGMTDMESRLKEFIHEELKDVRESISGLDSRVSRIEGKLDRNGHSQ